MSVPSQFLKAPQVLTTAFLTMAAGENFSAVFDGGTLNPVAFIFPANTDTQTFSLLDNTVPPTGYADEYAVAVKDPTGADVTFTAAALTKIPLDPVIALSINRFQLYTGTPQTTDVQVTVVLAPLIQCTF